MQSEGLIEINFIICIKDEKIKMTNVYCTFDNNKCGYTERADNIFAKWSLISKKHYEHIIEDYNINKNLKGYDEECSYIVLGSGGLIKSPRYPDIYPRELDCRILIDHTNATIVLYFLDLDIEDSPEMNDRMIYS
ncbi:hypothetical protein A3Q56_01425 [Intoshia linei]|uniref:CUB domain-containing protein n=1 Tax=Intoshia linei TaxID=1819745 RepID=A0A177BB32_9BILA|nr:hypothetical protein A3Q56_01425 [Intoshia linei]